MMKLLIIFILVASCKPTAIAGYRFAENDSYFNVEAIESFARLYGYVRWFHPSDEALEINWDKFAVLGVQKVKNIKSTIELKDTLLVLKKCKEGRDELLEKAIEIIKLESK